MNRLLLLCAVIAALPGLALAATDGTLGDSSSGSADITFNVTEVPGPKIRVQGLQDVVIDAEIGDILNKLTFFCVFMDQPGTFAMEVTANPLTSGQDIYPYTASFSNVPGHVILGSITVDTAAETFRATNLTPSVLPNCSKPAPPLNGDYPISMFVSVPGQATSAIAATATITVIVSAE